MSTATHLAHNGDLVSRVVEIFAEITRYPVEILDTEASLEEDLGIDSVKLGEVFSVLRERYNLPEKMDLPRESLKSISGVAAALQEFMASRSPALAGGPEAQMQPAEVRATNGTNGAARPELISRNGHAGHSMEIEDEVRQVFAEVTRYPEEILDPNASLEEDLGIDSVKFGEVFSVLREKYRLPAKMDVAPERLKTIAGVSAALAEFLSSQPGGTPAEGRQDHAPAPVTSHHQSAGDIEVENKKSAPAPEIGFHDEVLRVFAEVTRYPEEILDPEASLEEDLGIDSVKLGEVFSVLREKYDLPAKMDLPREQLQTIAGIAQALRTYLKEDQSIATHSTDGNDELAATNRLSDIHGDAYSYKNGSRLRTGLSAGLLENSFAALEPAAKPFAGKLAFVTGSGRGIGKAISAYLAKLGATVVVNSFHSRDRGQATADEIMAEGGKAKHLWGSVANPEQLDRMFDEIESEYGTLDFFISSASNGMLARLEEITTEDWEKAFRTNIIGLHQGAMRAAKLMKKNGGGKIITMSSPAAHGYVDYFGCMGAVKAAVESLTRSLAIELAPDNIQVNCVSPGPVYGELLNKWPEHERLIAQWEDNTAYKRLCEADDVAHFVAYLLSDPVKLFTGSVLVMDGGISSQGW